MCRIRYHNTSRQRQGQGQRKRSRSKLEANALYIFSIGTKMAPEIAVSEEQITTGTSDVSSAAAAPVVSTLPMMQSSMIRRVRRRKRRQAATHVTLAVGSALYLVLVAKTGLETFASDWTIMSGGGQSTSPDASHLSSVDEWELWQKGGEKDIAQFFRCRSIQFNRRLA